MRIAFGFLCLGMALVVPARAQTDDFNDNQRDPAMWGVDQRLDGNGVFTESNQRVEFTVTSSVDAHSTFRPWVGGLPVDLPWQATLRVQNNTVPPKHGANASIGLALLGPGTELNAITVELVADPFIDGVMYRYIYSVMETESGSAGEASSEHEGMVAAYVRLAYDPAAKVVSVSYSRETSGNPSSFQPLATYGIAGSGGADGSRDWGVSAVKPFTLGIYAYSEDMQIAAGTLWADDFVLEVDEPEPPTLSIRRENQNVKISWEASAVGYALETRSTVASGRWLHVSATPAVSNGAQEVLLPIQPQAQYFRLVK